MNIEYYKEINGENRSQEWDLSCQTQGFMKNEENFMKSDCPFGIKPQLWMFISQSKYDEKGWG